MTIDLDKERIKLNSTEERKKLIKEINDITYLGPVGETITEMKKKIWDRSRRIR